MFPVGKINAKAQKLIDCTFHAMHEGINAAQPDATLGDIGSAIQTYAEKQNYSVVRDFCGHGLGKVFMSFQTFFTTGIKVKVKELNQACFLQWNHDKFWKI